MAKKRTGRLGWFGKSALFLLLFCIPLMLGLLSLLWEFLDDYQKSLPENVAEETMLLFENRDMDTLIQYIDYTPHPFDTEESFQTIVDAHFAPKNGGEGEYTLISKMGGGEEKRYVVALDGVKVC